MPKAKNPLTTRRDGDDLFQRDVALDARARGDQQTLDARQAMRTYIIAFIAGLLLGVVVFGVFAGMVWSLLAKQLVEVGLMAGPAPTALQAVTGMYTLNFMTFVLVVVGIVAGIAFVMMARRHIEKFAVTKDHSDINDYVGDRHIPNIEELVQRYAIFPDAHAVSRSVSPTSIVSHIYLENHRKIPDQEVIERNADGTFKVDDDGNPVKKVIKMFDEKLRGLAYFSVGVRDPKRQKTFDPSKLKYKKDKDGKWITLADFIAEDWYIPEYETGAPAGAFLVEDGPVNTFVIAMTRGNKGQLSVNNSIDMFSREHEPQNMFINDPKGELAAGFHKQLEMRGYEVVLLNLMNPSKTHQFNVLGQAVAMARIGNFDKMRESLNTVLNTFFPVEGDDPFWGQAQQTLVRMMIFALIDFYLEEEREYLHLHGGKGGKDEATIAKELDEMWGKVTMFTVYQMLTSMSREEVKFKLPEPETDDDDIEEESDADDEGEQMTQLTAFLKLLTAMPENKMRKIALQQSDAMNLMADSEKTRATVYGIALVAMLFFTDGPITAITSASPRQTLDVFSFAFPRRLRFKINGAFLRYHSLVGKRVEFESYRDAAMTDMYEGADFAHETRLDSLGWVEYRFKGIYDNFETFTNDVGKTTRVAKPIYIRMKVMDISSNLPIFTFNFEFTRGYAKTVDGRKFLQNPRTGDRIMQGGTLREGFIDKEKGSFVRGRREERLGNGAFVSPIEQTDAVYNVRPKALFSITPPHLADYIKVVIVMTSVLFDASVGESYMTKSDGKPFYKTRNILDELGNMQFNGQGIPGLETKLSIGLAQGQEYTMVLQTMQQLRDVYGDSVDKIVSGNTAIFMYLISNDTEMLESLSKQAGSTHVTRATSKNVTHVNSVLGKTVGDEVGYSYQTQEEPLFSVDKLMGFTNGEAMILSAVKRADNSGEAIRPAPIHNTDASLLPMAWALHSNGHNSDWFKTAFQNMELATSSSDRDVYSTLPKFGAMYEKRLKQVLRVPDARKAYLDKNGWTEDDILNMNEDEVAEGVMQQVFSLTNRKTEIQYVEDGAPIEIVGGEDAALDDAIESTSETDETPDWKVAGFTEAAWRRLSDKERENWRDPAYREAQAKRTAEVDAAVAAGKVPAGQNMFGKDVSEAKARQKELHAEERKAVFLGNQLSLVQLREKERLVDALSQALTDADIGPGSLSERFDYIDADKANSRPVRIRHVASGLTVAELNEVDAGTEGAQEEWQATYPYVEQEIISAASPNAGLGDASKETRLAVQRERAENVDKLFDVTGDGLIIRKTAAAYLDAIQVTES